MIQILPFIIWKKPFQALAILGGLMWLSACSNAAQEEELARLRQQLTRDSTTAVQAQYALAQVQGSLDSAAVLGTLLQRSGTMSKTEASAKIKAIDSLLTATLDEMGVLEDVQEGASPVEALMASRMKEQKEALRKQQAYYRGLKDELEGLRVSVVDMGRVMKKQEASLIEKDAVIQQIQQQRIEQELALKNAVERLQTTELMIAKANADIQEAKSQARREQAKVLYEAGMNMKAEFDRIDNKTIAVGGKAAKRTLIRQALDYFERAYALGYENAQREALVIKSEKRYAKYLED